MPGSASGSNNEEDGSSGLEDELQKKSKGSGETSRPWDEWEREQEHRECSPLSFPLQGMVRGETEPVGQYLAPSLVSPVEFWGFG